MSKEELTQEVYSKKWKLDMIDRIDDILESVAKCDSDICVSACDGDTILTEPYLTTDGGSRDTLVSVMRFIRNSICRELGIDIGTDDGN